MKKGEMSKKKRDNEKKKKAFPDAKTPIRGNAKNPISPIKY